MAMILSLRQVNGDLSDNQSKLKAARVNEKEFSTSKFAVGEKVDNAADDHEGGTVIAVFRLLTATSDTPSTWKGTAHCSFLPRKN
jgi:hypothetical protein